jgi:hypothetical protein
VTERRRDEPTIPLSPTAASVHPIVLAFLSFVLVLSLAVLVLDLRASPDVEVVARLHIRVSARPKRQASRVTRPMTPTTFEDRIVAPVHAVWRGRVSRWRRLTETDASDETYRAVATRS